MTGSVAEKPRSVFVSTGKAMLSNKQALGPDLTQQTLPSRQAVTLCCMGWSCWHRPVDPLITSTDSPWDRASHPALPKHGSFCVPGSREDWTLPAQESTTRFSRFFPDGWRWSPNSEGGSETLLPYICVLTFRRAWLGDPSGAPDPARFHDRQGD